MRISTSGGASRWVSFSEGLFSFQVFAERSDNFCVRR